MSRILPLLYHQNNTALIIVKNINFLRKLELKSTNVLKTVNNHSKFMKIINNV